MKSLEFIPSPPVHRWVANTTIHLIAGPRRRSRIVRHVIRRIGIYLLAIWAAVTINFFLPRLAPGNPAEIVYDRLAQHGAVNPATLKALELEFGVNTTDPLWVQYISYLNN